jgi:tetratricopeptide (TPR) repeat protein
LRKKHKQASRKQDCIQFQLEDDALRKTLSLIFLALSFCLCDTRSASASYTYAQRPDGWEEQAQPPLHQLELVYSTVFSNPTDMVFFGGDLYILDKTGALTIVEQGIGGMKSAPLRNAEGNPYSFQETLALHVGDGGILVSDAAACEIVQFSLEGEFIRSFAQPDSPSYDSSIPFRVSKLSMDQAGNVYALVEGLYYGAALFSNQGEFLGFYGSNPVEMSVNARIEQMWKRLLSNEQAGAMQRFVPVSYSSFDMDNEGFVYTCSADVSMPSARVRKLNPSGKGLWDSVENMFGDASADAAPIEGLPLESRLTDIDVSEDGILSVLDSAKGRVFQYDPTGRILGVFTGAFSKASAIESFGERVFVLDSSAAGVSVFHLTGYGKACIKASLLHNQGKYVEAMPFWQEVLRRNSFSETAAAGMGKALYSLGDVQGALRHLRLSQDRKQYSQVLSRYRMKFARENFTSIAFGLAALAAATSFAAKAFKRREVFKPIRRHFSAIAHPINAIEDLIEENLLSAAFSSTVIICWIGLELVEYFGTGFPFNLNAPEDFNLIALISRTALLFMLWCIVNWSLSVLSDGKGTFKAIFCVSAYALLPSLLTGALSLAMSHMLVLNESAFISWVNAAGFIWSALMLFCGVMAVHQFSFEKTAANIALTIAGIAVSLFLLMLATVLFENVANLIGIVFNELTLRN